MPTVRAALLGLLTLVPVTAGETPVKLAEDEKALLQLVNGARRKEQLEPLTLNALLCAAARKHAENMARQGKFSHQLDGKGVAARVEDAGYDYRVVRENLALADGDADDPPPLPREIHDRWMASAGHKANILHPRVTEVGLAVTRSARGAYYIAVVLAAQRR